MLVGGLSSFAAPAAARPQTTLSGTVQDTDGDNRLEPAPGEDYVVRDDLGQPGPDRARRRRELLFFGRMTDSQMVDEESPRGWSSSTSSARRSRRRTGLGEGAGPQTVNEMARQLRNTVTPV